MYSIGWQKQLLRCPIPFEIVNSFHALKGRLQLGMDSHKPVTDVLIDGNLIHESLANIYSTFRHLSSEAVLTVITPVPDEKANPSSNLDEPKEVRDPRFMMMPSSHFDILNYLEYEFGQEMMDARVRTRQVTFAELRGLSPEDQPLPDNDLSQVIQTEIATVSASIHLDPQLLDDGYVPKEMSPTSVDEDLAQSSFSRHEYESCLRRWKAREKSMADFAREIVYRAMVTPASSAAELKFNAHLRLSQLLDVTNRRTYLVMGPKGTGKTTFLHFYRLFYGSDRNMLIADFLPFNFVSDAHSVYLQLERLLFDALKADGRSEIALRFSTHYDYRVASQDNMAANLYAEVQRLNVAVDVGFYSRWVEEVLFNCPTQDLVYTWREATGSVGESEISETDEPTQARRWRDSAVKSPTPQLIHSLSERYRKAWLRTPLEWLCRAIMEDVTELARLAAPDSSARSRRFRAALENLSREFKIPWDSLKDVGDDRIVDIARAGLSELSRDNQSVVVVIDNADRAEAPSTEIEIFKQSWQFLFSHSPSIDILFSIRDETFDQHQSVFEQIDQRIAAQSTLVYTNRFANISVLHIPVPSFKEVAYSRVYAVKQQLDRKRATEKTKTTFREYVGAALSSTDLDDLFTKIFGGDLRLNLQLLESVFRSPHIVDTDLYFRARQKLGLTKVLKDVNTYIQMHRLLTALMLQNHSRFVQRDPQNRFLNMYNAQLIEDDQPREENALVLHRTLGYVGRVAQAETNNIIENISASTLVPPSSVEKALALLNYYHLVAPAPGTSKANGRLIQITPCGEYYLSTLMGRLEYIENVYWEVWIDEDLMFGRFPIDDISDLLPFVDQFVEFLTRCEAKEAIRNSNNAKYDDFIRQVFSTVSNSRVSEKVKSTSMAQVLRIYFAERYH